MSSKQDIRRLSSIMMKDCFTYYGSGIFQVKLRLFDKKDLERLIKEVPKVIEVIEFYDKKNMKLNNSLDIWSF